MRETLSLPDSIMALPPSAIDGPVVEAERRRLDAVFAARLAVACAWPSGEVALFP